MIKNTLTLAKKQLEDHLTLGPASKLSIIEVAMLMDQIKGLASTYELNNQSIFFDYQLN